MKVQSRKTRQTRGSIYNFPGFVKALSQLAMIAIAVASFHLFTGDVTLMKMEVGLYIWALVTFGFAVRACMGPVELNLANTLRHLSAPLLFAAAVAYSGSLYSFAGGSIAFYLAGAMASTAVFGIAASVFNIRATMHRKNKLIHELRKVSASM